jgi:hypothetical protein
MVREIRVYVEGGGDSYTKARLREGFKKGFLKQLVALADSQGGSLEVIPCGDTDSTFKDFRNALRSNSKAFNILLVDSDRPVKDSDSPREHLLRHKKTWKLRGIKDEQCHLMVQIMEAWIIADIQALEDYYGPGLKASSIWKTIDVEQIDKRELEKSLKAATQKTKKEEYNKTKDAPILLQQIDASKVRKVARHCDHLFTTLEQKLHQ